MSKPEGADTSLESAVLDDAFGAAFDESLNPEPEKVEPEPEKVEKTEPEPEKVEPEPTKVEKTEPEPEKSNVIDIQDVIARTIAATKPPEKKEEPAAPVGPTPEELAAEEQYRKDWPEHAAREDRLKNELKELRELLKTTADALTQQVQPIAASVAESAEEKHVNAILAVHKDAFDLGADIEKWVAEQPDYLQPAYLAVLENGTAKQVNDFLTTFKKATGRVEEQPKEEPTPTPQKDDTRLKRMEVPTTVRTSISAEPDPDDFDSAFEMEAKKIKAA